MSQLLSPKLAALVVIAFAAAACSGGATTAPTFTFSPATQAPPTASPTTAPTASPVAAAPTIVLSEWKVAVPTTIKAGKVTFTISNSGTIQHELLVFKSDLTASAYPTDHSGDVIEDASQIDLLSDGENIDPAGTEQRTVELTPGTYVFACNIPGHFKAGMATQVTVTP